MLLRVVSVSGGTGVVGAGSVGADWLRDGGVPAGYGSFAYARFGSGGYCGSSIG